MDLDRCADLDWTDALIEEVQAIEAIALALKSLARLEIGSGGHVSRLPIVIGQPLFDLITLGVAIFGWCRPVMDD